MARSNENLNVLFYLSEFTLEQSQKSVSLDPLFCSERWSTLIPYSCDIEFASERHDGLSGPNHTVSDIGWLGYGRRVCISTNNTDATGLGTGL